MYLVDTSVWIEIILGTQDGEKAAELINRHNSFTAGIVIAEISRWCWANSVDVNEKISQIESLCGGILEFGRFAGIRAGFLCIEANKTISKGERNVGLIDSIIAAIAEENGLVVLTKDAHFRKFGQIKTEFI